MFRTSHGLVVSAVLTASATNVLGQLCNTSGFQDPPIEYRAKFRYWLPDASVPADIVARDIYDIRAAGAGGLEFLPYYLYGQGPESFERAKLANPAYIVPEIPDWSTYGFGTNAFNALFSSALQTVDHSGVLMDFAVGPNQGAGVPSEPGVLGLAVQLLMGNTTIQPGESFSGPVPQAQGPIEAITTGLGFQHPQHDYFAPNLTALTAYEVLNVENNTGMNFVTLEENSFLDLMPLLSKNESLQWTPPDNTKTWKVFSFYESYTNQRACDGGYNATTILSNGSWIVDHFSAAGAAKTTDFWDNYILTDIELAERLTVAGHYSWEDSMEQIAALYWTPNLLNLSKKAGLDIHPYLPVLFDASNTWGGYAPPYNGESFRFSTNGTIIGASKSQLNYRAMLNAGYQEYLMHLRNWSRSIGIKGFSTQPAYNLPLLMSNNIALLDAPEGESLGFQQSLDAYRQFSGPAHLANISIISTELGAVRGPPYSLQVPDLLQQIKRSFAGGFTTNVLHGYPATAPYAATTWPGYTPFYYRFTEMWNPIQPAWKHMKEQLDYVGRNQWILQQGSPQIDLAFYDYKDPWLPTVNYNSTNLRDLGFTYDYLGPENLASKDAYLRDGTVGVPAYKALISDHQTIITIEAASALLKLASSGLPIIFIGLAPSQVTPVNASLQAQLDGIMRFLMSSNNVYSVKTSAEVPGLLAQRNVTPRVALNCTSNPVLPVYRSAGTTDYIFFFNDQPIDATCTTTIHAPGVVPILYNAWTGTKSPLLQYTMSNSSLNIPIGLRSNETLVFALEPADSQPDYVPKHSSGALYALATTSGTKAMATITGATQFTCKSSATMVFEDPMLPASLNLSTWSLVVQDWHSAADRYAIETAITTHIYGQVPLVPWVEIDPALQHVSGIGVYTTKFTTPPSSTTTIANASTPLIGILSLPLIQHTVRVYLDSSLLDPIDPTNPIVSLGLLQPGREYELRVEVSTTLFNRVKAEANQTLFIGQTVTQLQPLYDSLPFVGYGLVGDVQVRWGVEVEVEC